MPGRRPVPSWPPAWAWQRSNGFFVVKEGWEYNLILAVALGFAGGIGQLAIFFRPPAKVGSA